MKKLEKLKLVQASDADRERLARWLYEWNLLQASDGGDEVDMDDKANSLDSLPEDCFVAPMDGSIEVGQIRLMAPVANENMVFAVVVSIAENGDIGFVPFSSLAEPATSDELLSGRDKELVCVYCLWNLRIVSADIMGKSWVVDLLDEYEMKRLTRAVISLEHEGCLPDDLRADAGPPVVNPEDPRREYKDYERQRIDMVFIDNSAVSKNSILYDPDVKREFLKAAESPESYAT